MCIKKQIDNIVGGGQRMWRRPRGCKHIISVSSGCNALLLRLIRTTQSNIQRCLVGRGPPPLSLRGGAHQPQSVRVMKMDLPAYTHTHTHAHGEVRRARRQQGEVKAINVSEPTMHHTSPLIDRRHQESVLYSFTRTPTDGENV